MRNFLNTFVSAIIILSIGATTIGCTQSSAKCKADSRKAKKNKVGWQK